MTDIAAKLRERGHEDLAWDLERAYLEPLATSVADNVRNADTFFDEYLEMLDEMGFRSTLKRDPSTMEEIEEVRYGRE